MSDGTKSDALVALARLLRAVSVMAFVWLVLLFLTSCGHLPPHWCRVDPVEVATIGTPEIRHCEGECTAHDGEWIVDDTWMVETAHAMLRWRECCEEGR